MKFFDFLAKCRLNWVGVDETLNLLLAEQEFVLDERFHICVALDNCLEKLSEIGALRLLTFHFGLHLRVHAAILVAHWLEIVP